NDRAGPHGRASSAYRHRGRSVPELASPASISGLPAHARRADGSHQHPDHQQLCPARAGLPMSTVCKRLTLLAAWLAAVIVAIVLFFTATAAPFLVAIGIKPNVTGDEIKAATVIEIAVVQLACICKSYFPRLHDALLLLVALTLSLWGLALGI